MTLTFYFYFYRPTGKYRRSVFQKIQSNIFYDLMLATHGFHLYKKTHFLHNLMHCHTVPL